MSLKKSKEFCETVPPHLLQSLRSVNVTDTDAENIERKLKERTTSQIVSYLQLALIKLRRTSVAAREFSTQMNAQRERTEFGEFLQQQVDTMRNS